MKNAVIPHESLKFHLTSRFPRMLHLVSIYFQRHGVSLAQRGLEIIRSRREDAKLEIEISIEFMDRIGLYSLAELNLHWPTNILSNVRVAMQRFPPVGRNISAVISE